MMFVTIISLLLIFAMVVGINFMDRPGDAVSEEELRRLRELMVQRQIEARGIKDPLVLAAMLSVKRHEFVLPGQEREAYEDGPLPIGEGQTISQPYIVAIMTELARVNQDSVVLEVGTGCGYQTAILAFICSKVYTIEINKKLGEAAMTRLRELGCNNVEIRIDDGYKGWPEAAPFDAILVTAAPDHVPQPLIDQLKVGGRLVIPVGDYYQELEIITRTETGIEREKVIPVRFVPMRGKAEERD
jgi:protein-L-isoaspartate(D-aspartate) O-methyltransferase